MMTFEETRARLLADGFYCYADGDLLYVRKMGGERALAMGATPMRDDLRAAIRFHKPALLNYCRNGSLAIQPRSFDDFIDERGDISIPADVDHETYERLWAAKHEAPQVRMNG